MIADTPTLVIEAGQAERHYWRDLWRYRELLLFLAWRDIAVRYKQTALGIAWALLRPLLTILVFTLVFYKLGNMPSDGMPYLILVCTALLPWQFFASAFTGASDSLIINAGMMSKVYFPRLVAPASAMIVSFVDFLLSGIILVGLMAWYGFGPNLRLLALPLFILMTFAAAMGAGLWAASLKVKHRDLGMLIPYVVQFGLYLSPVLYSSNLIPEKWRLLYSLNPMASVIDGFRWAILGGASRIHWLGLLLSLVLITLTLVSGVIYFRKTEKTFVDVI